MTRLSDEARRLIDELKVDDGPGRSVDARVWRSVSRQLDLPLTPMAAKASHALGGHAAAGVVSGLGIKLVVTAVAVAAVSGALLLDPKPAALRPNERRPSSTQALRVEYPPEAAPQAKSGLAEEALLLADAQRALHSGAASRALALIDQHRARFPSGAMAQEREAARILALCELGRLADAARAAQLFVKVWPDSPLRDRATRSCVAPDRAP